MRKILALLFGGGIAMLSNAAEFYCPNGGIVTTFIRKETPTGEVLCVKNRFTFKGYIAIPLKDNEIAFAQCNNTKGGEK